MTTSGTAAFNLDLNDLIEEAFERCGLELRTGYDFRTARRSLDLLTIEWSNRGINLWTIEEGEINMVTGQAEYNLPVDTIDLISHVIRTDAGDATNQTDLTITRISIMTYSNIPNKLITGRPIQVWVDRQSGATQPSGVNAPKIYVWPTPDDPGSQYKFVYWRLRRIQDAGTGVTTQGHPIPLVKLPSLRVGLLLIHEASPCGRQGPDA
jgi:hypothetical protein